MFWLWLWYEMLSIADETALSQTHGRSVIIND